MNSKQRITAILKHEEVDRIGIFEHFWGDTIKHWESQGHIQHGECIEDHFDFDIQTCWAFNLMIDMDFKLEVVSEGENTITYLDGNGATLKRHKFHDTTPEHIDFRIKTQEQWDEVKHMLTPDPRRINFEAYRVAKLSAEKANRFFVWSGVNVFECMHPICGHEHMLVGMALAPEWVQEMVDTYATLLVDLQKILFEQEGYPDGIWYYEDMGYKGSPFMSPTMYREIVKPGHVHTINYAKEHNLPVIMHSCGYIEPLLSDMIDAGIDCLQVIEVKAGMDLLKLYEEYGDQIAFMGGIDVRSLYSNDKAEIDAELQAKIPFVKKGYGYVVHSDHSIPKTVDYDIYKYFIKTALELGTY